MKNMLIIIILIFSMVIISGIKINQKLDFNLIYTRDITSILARSGVEERQAWHYDSGLIKDDRGWIWEISEDLAVDEIITIYVEGDKVVDYKKLKN